MVITALVAIISAVAAFLCVLGTTAQLWIVAVPILTFAVVFFILRHPAPAFGAIVWVGFGIWEALLDFRILCDEECNIRIDLLFLIPFLTVVSAIVAASSYRRLTLRRQAPK